MSYIYINYVMEQNVHAVLFEQQQQQQQKNK